MLNITKDRIVKYLKILRYLMTLGCDGTNYLLPTPTLCLLLWLLHTTNSANSLSLYFSSLSEGLVFLFVFFMLFLFRLEIQQTWCTAGVTSAGKNSRISTKHWLGKYNNRCFCEVTSGQNPIPLINVPFSFYKTPDR